MYFIQETRELRDQVQSSFDLSRDWLQEITSQALLFHFLE